MKYNGVLRGLNSSVSFLRKQFTDLCCSAEVSEQLAAEKITFEKAKATANRYTTTLHVINSGIVKTVRVARHADGLRLAC